MAAHSTSDTKPQPVLVAASLLAALTAVVGGLAGLGVDNKIVAIVTVLLAALNVAVGVYVKGEVVPFDDTATYVNTAGELVAGPASPLPDGTRIPEAVDL